MRAAGYRPSNPAPRTNHSKNKRPGPVAMMSNGVAEAPRPTPWYARWYVWAAVGAVAVGGYATYGYATREPTAVRGF